MSHGATMTMDKMLFDGFYGTTKFEISELDSSAFINSFVANADPTQRTPAGFCLFFNAGFLARYPTALPPSPSLYECRVNGFAAGRVTVLSSESFTFQNNYYADSGTSFDTSNDPCSAFIDLSLLTRTINTPGQESLYGADLTADSIKFECDGIAFQPDSDIGQIHPFFNYTLSELVATTVEFPDNLYPAVTGKLSNVVHDTPTRTSEYQIELTAGEIGDGYFLILPTQIPFTQNALGSPFNNDLYNQAIWPIYNLAKDDTVAFVTGAYHSSTFLTWFREGGNSYCPDIDSGSIDPIGSDPLLSRLDSEFWVYKIQWLKPELKGILTFQLRGALQWPFAIWSSNIQAFTGMNYNNFCFPVDYLRSADTVFIGLPNDLSETVDPAEYRAGTATKAWQPLQPYTVQPYFSWEFVPYYIFFVDVNNVEFSGSLFNVNLFDVHEIRAQNDFITLSIELFELGEGGVLNPFKYPTGAKNASFWEFVLSPVEAFGDCDIYSMYNRENPPDWSNGVVLEYSVESLIEATAYTQKCSFNIPLLVLSTFPKIVPKLTLKYANVESSETTTTNLNNIRPLRTETRQDALNYFPQSHPFNDESTFEVGQLSIYPYGRRRTYYESDYLNPQLQGLSRPSSFHSLSSSPPPQFDLQYAKELKEAQLQSHRNRLAALQSQFAPLQSGRTNALWYIPLNSTGVYIDQPARNANMTLEFHFSYSSTSLQLDPSDGLAQCTITLEFIDFDNAPTFHELKVIPYKYIEEGDLARSIPTTEKLDNPTPSGPWTYATQAKIDNAKRSNNRPDAGLVFNAKTEPFDVPIYDIRAVSVACNLAESPRPLGYPDNEFNEYWATFGQLKVVTPGIQPKFIKTPERGEPINIELMNVNSFEFENDGDNAKQAKRSKRGLAPQQSGGTVTAGHYALYFDGLLLLSATNEATLKKIIAESIIQAVEQFYAYVVSPATPPDGYDSIDASHIVILRYRDFLTSSITTKVEQTLDDSNTFTYRRPGHSTGVVFTILDDPASLDTNYFANYIVSWNEAPADTEFVHTKKFNYFFALAVNERLSPNFQHLHVSPLQYPVEILTPQMRAQAFNLPGTDHSNSGLDFFINFSRFSGIYPGSCFTRDLGTCGAATVGSSGELFGGACDIQCPLITPELYHADPSTLAFARCTMLMDCPTQNTHFYYESRAVAYEGYEFPMVECALRDDGFRYCASSYFSRNFDNIPLDVQKSYQTYEVTVPSCPTTQFLGGQTCTIAPTLAKFSTKVALSSERNGSDFFVPVPGDKVTFQWQYTGKPTNLVTIFVRIDGTEYQLAPVARVNSTSSDTPAIGFGDLQVTWPSTGVPTTPTPFTLKTQNIDDDSSADPGPTIFLRFLTLDYNDTPSVESVGLPTNDGSAETALSIEVAACQSYQGDDAPLDLCQNGGVCQTDSGLCKCVPPFTGKHCEVHKCAALGCSSEHTTNCNLTAKTCSCEESWGGPTCQEYLSCADLTDAFEALNKCNQRGYIATKLEGDVLSCDTTKCQCLPGYTQSSNCKQCQIECQNGGRTSKSCTCTCARGFFGEYCQCRAKTGSIIFDTIPDFISDIAESLTQDPETQAAVSASFSQTLFNEWTASLFKSIRFDLLLDENVEDNDIQLTNFEPVPRSSGDDALKVSFTIYYNCNENPTTTSGELTARFSLFATQNPDFFSAIKNSRAAIEAKLAISLDPVVNPETSFTDAQCVIEPTGFCKSSKIEIVPETLEEPEEPTEQENAAISYITITFATILASLCALFV